MRRFLIVIAAIALLVLVLFHRQLGKIIVGTEPADAESAMSSGTAASRGAPQDSRSGRVVTALAERTSLVTKSGVRVSAKTLKPSDELGLEWLFGARPGGAGAVAESPVIPPSPSTAAGDEKLAQQQAIDALLSSVDSEDGEASVPPGVVISGVLTSPQMVVVERAVASSARAAATLIDDNDIELWIGGTNVLCRLSPGNEGYTIEAEISSEANGRRGLTTVVTLWDRQTILLSDPTAAGELTAVTLSLVEPNLGAAVAHDIDDPFASP